MDIWVNIDSEGRIFCSTLDEKYADEDSIKIEVDDDFDLSKQGDYIYQDGELVYDGKISKEIEEKQKAEQKAIEVEKQFKIATQFFVRSQSPTMTDVQALSVSLLFPEWTIGETYSHKEIVRYNGKLYRCNQAHTSSAEYNTSVASLWTEIQIAPDGIMIWHMPGGSHDAPNVDEKVYYPGAEDPVYMSKIPRNTTIPGSDERYWEMCS